VSGSRSKDEGLHRALLYSLRDWEEVPDISENTGNFGEDRGEQENWRRIYTSSYATLSIIGKAASKRDMGGGTLSGGRRREKRKRDSKREKKESLQLFRVSSVRQGKRPCEWMWAGKKIWNNGFMRRKRQRSLPGIDLKGGGQFRRKQRSK